MIKRIELETFLVQVKASVLLDVRSESEFENGHIPSAISIPLLRNEERVKVGTCFKNKGQQAAIELGYQLVGPRFHEIIQEVLLHCPQKQIALYCFRGGLRSRIMAYLLDTCGCTVYVLEGGYKKFRNFVLNEVLSRSYPFHVLGGFTGSGKTEILQLLAENNQVIDIEKLASHRGSSFGQIGMQPSPSQEHFENMLAMQLFNFNENQAIWIEDENRNTGRITLPEAIYRSIRNSKLLFLETDLNDRIHHIKQLYGVENKSELEKATKRLHKRLGDLRCREAIEYLHQNQWSEWIQILLSYYDKTYQYGLEKRNPALVSRIPKSVFIEKFIKS